jgi:hypothetical protein
MERWQVRARKIPDPYERSIDVLEAHRTKYDRAILFYLMRGNDTYDHAADANHFATRRSIQRAAREFEVGIHPSYGSSVNNELHEQEHGVLQQITGMPVRISRQHFLRWRLPDTLSALSHRNHAEDHTLGFSDRAGFRAGTCTPFPWYDLERETGTTLMLHPFAVMDSALIEQQRLGADDVERRMNVMSDLVRAVGGQYISVWHDRYLSGHREFASWPAVFTRVMEHAKP